MLRNLIQELTPETANTNLISLILNNLFMWGGAREACYLLFTPPPKSNLYKDLNNAIILETDKNYQAISTGAIG